MSTSTAKKKTQNAPATKNNVPNNNSANKKVNNKKKRTAPKTTLTRPVIYLKVSLKSVEPQRLFRRLYERTDVALIWLDTVLDKFANHEELCQADHLIRERIKECADDLSERIAQMKHLRSEHGLEDVEITYRNSWSQKVEAQTPMSIQFSNLFTLFDDLMCEVDALWFSGVIERDQRREAAKRCSKIISSLSSTIINFNGRAQNMVKKMKEDSTPTPAEIKTVTPVAKPAQSKENPAPIAATG